MIFVTVGHQMPFDRLVRAMDRWAQEEGHGTEVIAQIGDAAYEPSAIPWVRSMPPSRFRSLLERADAVVAHAGMGTIITALSLGKPLLVMPRRGDLAETRNDHQVATARRFAEAGLVLSVADPEDLPGAMRVLGRFSPGHRCAARASDELLERLRAFALRETAPSDAVRARRRVEGRKETRTAPA